jgi:hypothetical protein
VEFIYNDGGRKDAGYKGIAGDCVCRSISIAAGVPYQQVYDRLSQGNAGQRITRYQSKMIQLNPYYADKLKKKYKKVKTAAAGISVKRKWFKQYMNDLGFVWVPTMLIGQGCKVHLAAGELPAGRLVVMVSKHATAVIDNVIHDTHDPSREGTRCVYGYYKYQTVNKN